MTFSDQSDNNSIKPTHFDLARLNALEVGGTVDGELGNWRALRYKDSYILMLFNSPDKKEYSEFIDLESMVVFMIS